MRTHYGDYLYTSDLMSNQVVKIDADTGTVVGEATVRDLPHGNHLHRIPSLGSEKVLINGSLGNMVYTDSGRDPLEHQLTFVDPESMQTLHTVDFENGVRPSAITEDGRKIYVQVSYFHGFHEYNTEQDRITRTMYLPQTEHVPEARATTPLSRPTTALASPATASTSVSPEPPPGTPQLSADPTSS